MDDLISRLSELRSQYNLFDETEHGVYHTLSEAIKAINALEQPEIVLCKDCVKRNRKLGSLDEHYNRYNKSQCCPMIEFRGMPQGHEFDYQYCSWAERRTDED